MAYITSRRSLEESPAEFGNQVRFNLWKNKWWPYKELLVGDQLFWYSTLRQCIVYKSHVKKVLRFEYSRKDGVADRLQAEFGGERQTYTRDPYYVEGPDEGICLAYTVWRNVEQISLPKPTNLRFPQLGWLRTGVDELTQSWIEGHEEIDETTLDEIAPSGTVISRLLEIDRQMANVNPERVEALVSRTLRRDTALVHELKRLCDFRCQIPGCGVRIPKRQGGFYVEVAHIKPVSKGGQSVIGNLLVLCPNHHKEIDYGDFKVSSQDIGSISGELNGKEFTVSFLG